MFIDDLCCNQLTPSSLHRNASEKHFGNIRKKPIEFFSPSAELQARSPANSFNRNGSLERESKRQREKVEKEMGRGGGAVPHNDLKGVL